MTQMTTENKAEAEKIARGVIASHVARQSIRRWTDDAKRADLINTFTQALLDFKEKDVMGLVEALVSVTPTHAAPGKCYCDLSHDLGHGHQDKCVKAAALVRKFKGGKEG